MPEAYRTKGDPDAVRAVWKQRVYPEGDCRGAGDLPVLCVQNREEGGGEAADGDGMFGIGGRGNIVE